MKLQKLVTTQVMNHLNVDEHQLEYLTHPSPNHLHDPLYYKDMRELVTCLHQFKKKQEKDPSLLLVVDGDYDTDGVCAATILNAALSVFGFNYRIYIPTMADGYGLSKAAVDNMIRDYRHDDEHIGMILTADNGIKAFSGVSYAKKQGIDVLITDHHPSDAKLPDAKAVVDPLRHDDLYPFKGNSGATVAWKTMLAYANLFAPDTVDLIESLVVFAGISNVADVMPMQNENRYMVVRALESIRRLLMCTSYESIISTPYAAYNTAFYGLYDIVTTLQKRRDTKREAEGKKPYPLPSNEELIAWYISPILNAPRRIHYTCFEALCAFMVTDHETRKLAVNKLLDFNEEKSAIVNRIVDALPEDVPNIICINAGKGISGLVASKVYERTGKPAVVFAVPDDTIDTIIYNAIPNVETLSASARSGGAYALDRIITAINEKHPNFVAGGGHAGAAGLSINGAYFSQFVTIFNEVAEQIREEIEANQEVVVVPSNVITLTLSSTGIVAEYEIVENDQIITTSTPLELITLGQDIKDTMAFVDSLRPFGKDYSNVEPTFVVNFNQDVLQMSWNPQFWKTFKFMIGDVELLTFNEDWANTVKQELSTSKIITAGGKLRLNEWNGKVTSQIVLDPIGACS